MVLTINLYGVLLSTQEIYSGKRSHHKRVEYARQIAFYTSQAIDNWWKDKELINYPCNISFSFIIANQKLFDTGNYSYTAKIIEDTLKGRVIVDDDTRYIHDWQILRPVRNRQAPFNVCDVALGRSNG